MNRAARAIVAGAIDAYLILVSPSLRALFGPACRFEPSCAQYAKQAILEHGVWYGGSLAVRRLARCRPLGGEGYDPVPRSCT